MENPGRREFIKGAALFLVSQGAWAGSDKVHVELAKKSLKYYIKKGHLPGKRVLVIGGIHGNEIGAYKSADLLIDTHIQKGELIVVPRSNFVSILAKQRGYNGDMNRKFASIAPQDPDLPYVTALKELILQLKPDIVISMHDGVGFHRLNPHNWGQCVVIDEKKYKNFQLYKNALGVVNEANRSLPPKRHLVVYDTCTFSKNIHKEQKLALTGWCLKHDIQAYCIESSRNLPLLDQIDSHLAMLDAFFDMLGISISPSPTQMRKDIKSFFPKSSTTLTLQINSTRHTFTKSSRIKIKKGSNIKIVDMQGPRGIYLLPKGIDLNWNSFFFSKPLDFEMKHDYERVFKLEVVPT